MHSESVQGVHFRYGLGSVFLQKKQKRVEDHYGLKNPTVQGVQALFTTIPVLFLVFFKTRFKTAWSSAHFSFRFCYFDLLYYLSLEKKHSVKSVH